MFQTLKRLAAVLLLAATLPACATITSGTSQSIALMTEPAGATCTMQREGAVIGVVNPTPGAVQVSKSSRDIAVRCTRAGHSPGVQVIPAQFQAMTAGNILIGGVIGLAVDAASGAMARYPESAVVILPPESFASEQSREAFFESRFAETRRLFDERIAAARSACPRDNRIHCDSQVDAVIRERDEELARLDRLRREARINT